MIKILKYFAIIIVLFIAIQTYNYYKNKYNIKNVTYFDLNLKSKKHTFSKSKSYILYFDPDCGSCSEILKKSNLSKSIIFITPNKNINSINNFIKKNNLSSSTVFIDLNNTFAKDFGQGFVLNIPTLLLINHKKEVEDITNSFIN